MKTRYLVPYAWLVTCLMACTGADSSTSIASPTTTAEAGAPRTPSATDPEQTSIVSIPFRDGCSQGRIAPNSRPVQISLVGPNGATATGQTSSEFDHAFITVRAYGAWSARASAQGYHDALWPFDVSGPQTDLKVVDMRRDCGPPAPICALVAGSSAPAPRVPFTFTVTNPVATSTYAWAVSPAGSVPAAGTGVSFTTTFPANAQAVTYSIQPSTSGAGQGVACSITIPADQPPLPCFGMHQPFERLQWDNTRAGSDIQASVDIYAPGTHTLTIWASIDGGPRIWKGETQAVTVCSSTIPTHLMHRYAWQSHPAQRWWYTLVTPEGVVTGPVFIRE